MATGTILLPLLGGVGDATNPPAAKFTTANRPYLAFDASTDELISWSFRMPENYASALAAKIIWSGSASTTTSHTARWAVEVMATTPETDSVANDTDSYDSPNEADDDILGTTAKRPQALSITLTNADGVAAGDYVAIRVSRNADHANDDLTEDAWLWAVSLEYTTT